MAEYGTNWAIAGRVNIIGKTIADVVPASDEMIATFGWDPANPPQVIRLNDGSYIVAADDPDMRSVYNLMHSIRMP